MHLSARATPHAGSSNPRHSASSRDSVHSETVANCHARWVAGARAEVACCLSVGVGSSFSSFVSAGRLWMCVSCQADRAPYNVNVTTSLQTAHESRRPAAVGLGDPEPRAHRADFDPFLVRCIGVGSFRLTTSYLADGRAAAGAGRLEGRARIVSVSLVVVLNIKAQR